MKGEPFALSWMSFRWRDLDCPLVLVVSVKTCPLRIHSVIWRKKLTTVTVALIFYPCRNSVTNLGRHKGIKQAQSLCTQLEVFSDQNFSSRSHFVANCGYFALQMATMNESLVSVFCKTVTPQKLSGISIVINSFAICCFSMWSFPR